MSTVVIVPPAPLLILADVKLHLRVDHDEEDTLIGALMAAVETNLQGPAGWLRRAIGLQTLETSLGDAEASSALRLFFPPIRSIVSVTTTDAADADHAFDPANYRLADGWLLLKTGAVWPPLRSGPDSIRIRYTAGYDALPAPIRAAMLLMIGDLYVNRETTGIGRLGVIPMSTTVDALLSPYRVYG